MPEESDIHIDQFTLKLNGAPAPKELIAQILDWSVENSLHLPDLCTLRLHDAEFVHLDANTFKEGTRVDVFAAQEGMSFEPLFVGEVTALEMDLSSFGLPMVSVRCQDYSHRLHRGRKARSFQQVSDSDIVQQIAAGAGLTVEADSTGVVHDWVFQNNQTDWEFLCERADKTGHRLYMKGDKKLFFKKMDAQTDGVTLEWGRDLRSFRPRMSAGPQVDEVTVRGWDPKAKQAIVSTRQTALGVPETTGPAQGGMVAQKAFGGTSKITVCDQPVHSQTEADHLAQSVCDNIGNAFLEADGLVRGKPQLKAGAAVNIANIGDRFSGKYNVTSTTHVYNTSEGYSVQFSCTGKNPGTLLGLLEQGASKRQAMGQNILVGIVTDIKDPEDQGRIKVKYPAVTEDHASFWARIASPMAGKLRGFEFVPEVGDEVLVAFEHGDVRRPYILGALWNGVDKAPMPTGKAIQGGKVIRRRIKSRLGHRMTFFDTPDNLGGITLKTEKLHRVELNDSDKRILVKTKKGHQILLDDENDQIVIQDRTGKNKITIKSGDNSITAECNGDFSVNAKGKVAIQGAQGVNVSSPAEVQVNGQAAVIVQGGVVKIN